MRVIPPGMFPPPAGVSLIPPPPPNPNDPRFMVPGAGPGTFYGPAQPPTPREDLRGRQFAYSPGFNLNYGRPIAETTGVSLDALRGFAEASWVVRGAIETRKDTICTLDWTIRKRGTRIVEDQDAVAAEIETFLRHPERVQNEDGDVHFSLRWEDWLRMWLDDLVVIDAPAIWYRRTLGGDLFSLDILDGASVKRVLSVDGRPPAPPHPAYQQVLYGSIGGNYALDEMLYGVRNRRSYRAYGYSPIEQLWLLLNLVIRRDVFKLQYYSEGSMPDAFIKAAKDWGPDQIEEFDNYINGMAGNTAERRRLHTIPYSDGNPVVQFKEPLLKDEMDDLILRGVCWLLGVNPMAVVDPGAYASGKLTEKSADEEGRRPWLKTVKGIMDDILAIGFRRPNYEWIPQTENKITLDRVTADKIRIDTGLASRDQVREEYGQKPLPDGVGAEVTVATAAVPLAEALEAGFPVTPGFGSPSGAGAPKPKGNEDDAVDPEDVKERVERRKRKLRIQLGRLKNPAGDAALPRLTAGLTQGLAALAGPIADAAAAEYAKVEPEQAARMMRYFAGVVPGVARADEEPEAEMSNAEADRIAKQATYAADWSSLYDVLRVEIGSTGTGATEAAADSIGLASDAPEVLKTNAEVVEYARTRSAELVGKKWVDGELVDNPNKRFAISETTRAHLREEIVRAFEEGRTADELAASIRERFDFSEQRAALIARTELGIANTQANLDLYARSTRVTRKRWLLSSDHDHPDECDLNHSEGWIPYRQDFASGTDAYPAHPGCRCDMIVEVAPEVPES